MENPKEETTKEKSIFSQLEVGKEYEQEIFELGEKPKQRLERYSERFDNDKSSIGNPDTWGKRLVEETVEEACDKIFLYQPGDMSKSIAKKKAVDLAKWQAEQNAKEIQDLKNRLDIINKSTTKTIKLLEDLEKRSYSGEEILELVEDYEGDKFHSSTPLSFISWFKQFKKK